MNKSSKAEMALPKKLNKGQKDNILLKITQTWMKKLKKLHRGQKKHKTKKVFKISIDEEQSPYLKLQAKNLEERKAMQKKLTIFNIATQAISDNEVDSDDDDFLDL